MKVQRVQRQNGVFYILIDNGFNKIVEVEQFSNDLYNQKCSANTIKNYMYQLKLFYNFMDISDLSFELIIVDYSSFKKFKDVIYKFQEYLEQERKISDRSINIYSNTVIQLFVNYSRNNLMLFAPFLKEGNKSPHKGILSGMYQNQKLVVNAFRRRDSKRIKIVQKKMSREEYVRLIDLCRNYRDKIVLGLGFEGGFRRSEIIGVLMRDIVVSKNTVIIKHRTSHKNGATVKNYSEREIQFVSQIMKLIIYYILNERENKENSYLLQNKASKYRGLSLSLNSIDRIYERLTKRYQKLYSTDRKFTSHMARHGHGNELREVFALQGISSDVARLHIMKRLGHRQIETSAIYCEPQIGDYNIINMLKMPNLNNWEGILDDN